MEKIGDPKLEARIFPIRLTIAVVFMLVLCSILIYRTYVLQIEQHQYYKIEALGNQMRILPISPTRGKIFDRNGKILATNKLGFTLTITPEKVSDLPKTLAAMKAFKLIDDTDIKNFKKRRPHYKKFHNIPIKYQLSEAEIARFLVSNKFIGVGVEPYFSRIYPHNNSSAHSIGYVSRISKKDQLLYDKKNYLGTHFVGKTGIEKQYETLLHGKSGRKQIERNVSGRVIDSKVITPAISGKDLFLTLDIELQKKAELLLKNKRGSVILLDVNNGEVLSMVSTPNYNLNWFVNGISTKNYQKLQTSKNIPLFNRSIQGLYPPGSTIKPMIALAGLEEQIITKNSKTYCPGYFKLNSSSRKFNDWKRTGHGHVNVEDAIAQSCDVFFYSLANKTGIDTLHDNLIFFNFGRKTGIDLPGEASGILPSRAWKKANKKEPWYRGETLIAGIGQGFITVSPLQLASATAALATKGQLLQPRLLKNVQTPHGKIQEMPDTPKRQIPIKDIKNWELVINGMQKTIYDPKGTARRLNKKLKYTIAGKTGTAQVFGLDPEEQYIAEKYEEHLRDHALFIAFAPIKNPEVAIVVVIENAGSGSIHAAPLARKMLDSYFATK